MLGIWCFRGAPAAAWQTLCLWKLQSVKTHGKTITHLGLTIRSPFQRSRHHAFAHAFPAGAFSLHQCLDKIVLHHRRKDHDEPDSLVQSILRVVETNGEVTLPKSATDSPHAWGVILTASLTLVGLGFLIFFSLR